MFGNEELDSKYKLLSRLSTPLKAAQRDIIGREYEMTQLMSALSRPELCNALLLGQAGVGKTAVVQGVMRHDENRLYLEVELDKMTTDAGTPEKMASMLKGFFDEAEQFVIDEGWELVMFIDEFHRIIQLSEAAVEGIKPVLAASGTRGIRIIAATTNREFHKYVSSNQPLVERLQRINLSPPDVETTVEILTGMAKRYEVADEFYDDRVFRLIVEYTNHYMPASSQPRKSIQILDGMVGWHRFTGRPMDRELLGDVIMESTGNNVAVRVDGSKIKQQLDSKVFSQDQATTAVARRLQLVVADLHDKTKPLSSMLLTGSTGVGKALENGTWMRVDDERGYVAIENLVPGDRIFDETGAPTKVIGVFPQGLRRAFRVHIQRSGHTDFSAGAISIDCNDEHLWDVMDLDHPNAGFTTMTLAAMIQARDERGARWAVPAPGPIRPQRVKELDVEKALWIMFFPDYYGAVPAEVFMASPQDRETFFDEYLSRRGAWTVSDRQARSLVSLARMIGRRLEVVEVINRQGESAKVVLRETELVRVSDGVRTHIVDPILDIEDLGYDRPMTCIKVKAASQLFQAGHDHVVTHNTELTKQLAHLLFGDDQRHLIRFDCSEYAHDSTFLAFREELTRRVWDVPFAILLFDEIEKASAMVTRTLLQVLDDARLTDQNNNEVSFKNTYIILTTNAASEIYKTVAEYASDDTGSGVNLEDYKRLIRRSISQTSEGNRFPPELLGRIDAIVPFQPLSLLTQTKIIRSKLRQLVADVMTKHNVWLDVGPRVLTYLAEDKANSDSDAGGARDAVARLNDEVTTAVATFINEHPSERQLGVDIVGELVSENKSLRVSDAKVVVRPRR